MATVPAPHAGVANCHFPLPPFPTNARSPSALQCVTPVEDPPHDRLCWVWSISLSHCGSRVTFPVWYWVAVVSQMSSRFYRKWQRWTNFTASHTHRSRLSDFILIILDIYGTSTSLLPLLWGPVGTPVCGCILQTLDVSQQGAGWSCINKQDLKLYHLTTISFQWFTYPGERRIMACCVQSEYIKAFGQVNNSLACIGLKTHFDMRMM